MQKILGDLKKAIEKITVNDKNVFYYFNYLRYQRLFIQAYFQQGFLYEKLDPDDISLLDTILGRMTKVGEDYINYSITKWKAGDINQQEILNILGYERDSIDSFIRDIDKIKGKIVVKRPA